VVSPEKKSGGSSALAHLKAQRTAEAEFDLLKLRQQRTERTEQLVTANLEAELRDRLISRRKLTRDVIASESAFSRSENRSLPRSGEQPGQSWKNPAQERAAIEAINELRAPGRAGLQSPRAATAR
jgi:hypothetical protein